MSNLTMPLIIEDTYVRQDEQGRYSLNDLHQAAGGEPRHQPSRWLENQQTQELIAEIESETRAKTPVLTTGIPVVKTAEGRYGGTYAARELVYAYAMWISPTFNLTVIRTFDALVTGKRTGNASAVQLGAQRLLLATVRQLKASNDAFEQTLLQQQVRDLCNQLGMAVPSLDLIGRDPRQQALLGV
jgi:hypothetical protein